MKKPTPPEDPDAHEALQESRILLRHSITQAVTFGAGDRQRFLIETQGKTQSDDDAPNNPAAPPWEDNSGEGAASALESLRKLEQSRVTIRPPEERPSAA